MAKIDVTIHKNTSNTYKIEGYPTMKIFVDSEVKDYNGGRSYQSIVD